MYKISFFIIFFHIINLSFINIGFHIFNINITFVIKLKIYLLFPPSVSFFMTFLISIFLFFFIELLLFHILIMILKCSFHYFFILKNFSSLKICHGIIFLMILIIPHINYLKNHAISFIINLKNILNFK